MKRHWLLLSLVGLLGLLSLTACDLSLAGDVTPPPGYRPPTAAPVKTKQIVYPVVPPDPTQGAALYVEKCAPCHGPSGMGNGPLAAQLPVPVTPVGSAEVARLVKPASWFTIITEGRMDRRMPPFSSLTDRQRWDLVAYLYTLSTPDAVLQDGKRVFEENCQSCHGVKGAGDGQKAASLGSKVPDWREPARLAQRSGKDLFTTISSGAGQAMPAFSSPLKEEQRWAVAAYVRSLTFAGGNSASVQPTTAVTTPVVVTAAPTPTAAGTAVGTSSAPLTRVVFSGKVTHSGKKELPKDLKVTLQGFDGMTPAWQAVAEVQADGTYQVKDVELVKGRVFIASLVYQNVEFSSETVHAGDVGSEPVVELPISITDSSTDASVLMAQRVHIFLDFTLDGRVQIAQLYVVINPTENAIVPADAKTPGLVFELPQGADNLQFQDGELGGRFIKTASGFGDLLEVLPKAMHQVLYGFDLPYDGNRTTIKLPFTLPVDSLVVMAPASGVTLESPGLRSTGQRQVDNTTINLYSGSDFKKGTILELNISGKPSAAVPGVENTTSTDSLMIGLGVFGAALIAVGWWLLRQRKSKQTDIELDAEEETSEDTEDGLLDAIVALDDLYQAGKLPEAAYLERRTELKARLKALKDT